MSEDVSKSVIYCKKTLLFENNGNTEKMTHILGYIIVPFLIFFQNVIVNRTAIKK